MRKISACCFGLAVLVGCSTFKVPTERFIASESAIRGAEEAGAVKVPAASYHLQLARDESEEAKRLVADGRNELAHNMLVRAEADADLALALAREAPVRAQAQEAINRAKALEGGH